MVRNLLGSIHTSDQSGESLTSRNLEDQSQARDPVLITKYLSLIVTRILRGADNQQVVRSVLSIPKEISISDIGADFQNYVEFQTGQATKKTYQYEWDQLLRENLEISRKLQDLIK